ncbi:MAG: DsbA family protein [Candidatus Latescibacterota bacterium]|nr:DsbA family protein [Candidatus Latescibacterota bacterium]
MQNENNAPILFYVADPMCSWCWGFTPTIEALRADDRVDLRYVMGGLARDSQEPMPADIRSYVQGAWREVESRTGARFNWDFWQQCEPRRSTYPACRAALAAANQGRGQEMFHRIQQAYYLEARNPADSETLVALAGDLDLDGERFATDLASDAIEEALQEDFHLRRKFQATAFPSLVLQIKENYRWLSRGWEESNTVLARLDEILHSTIADEVK